MKVRHLDVNDTHCLPQPFKWFKVHPIFEGIIDGIVIFKYTKRLNAFFALNTLPWASKTHLILTLSEEKILVKMGQESAYKSYPLDVVLGPQLQVQHLDYGEERELICINFKAGALEKLAQIPVGEMLNRTLEARDVFGPEVTKLKQKLLEARSDGEIMQYVNAFFLKKLKTIPSTSPFDLAIQRLVDAQGNVHISTLAHLASMSLRQFERKSLQCLGMSPKLFAKLTRFSYAYVIKENNPHLLWTDISYASGYYDQMHLIRDFKIFSGCSPKYAFGEQTLPKVNAVTSLQGHGRLQNTDLFKFPLNLY